MPQVEDTMGHQMKLHYLNLRFVGVGFRGYIIKKVVKGYAFGTEGFKHAVGDCTER